MEDKGFTPRNIMVTGGAGFIGSYFLVHMVKKYPGYNFYNVDILDYCASLKRVQEVEGHPNYEFIKGDVCSMDLIDYVLKEKRIDTVVHFAAQTSVDNSWGNSLTFTKTNVMGTHVLLEASLKNDIKRFVHISTDEIYGNWKDEDAATENSILDPVNPYAASKAGAEFLVKSYAKSFRLPTIITRSNNIYGPNQYPEKIIGKFVSQVVNGNKMSLHGNGNNLRTYIHVEDVVSAFDIILHNGKNSSIYNIGGDNEFSNNDIAVKIAGMMGKDPVECMEYVDDRPFNDERYFVNSEALKALGWEERVDFDKGLMDTVEWFKNNQDYFD